MVVMVVRRGIAGDVMDCVFLGGKQAAIEVQCLLTERMLVRSGLVCVSGVRCQSVAEEVRVTLFDLLASVRSLPH